VRDQRQLSAPFVEGRRFVVSLFREQHVTRIIFRGCELDMDPVRTIPILRMNYASPQWRFVSNKIGVADGEADSLDNALKVLRLDGSENSSAGSFRQHLQIVGSTELGWTYEIVRVRATRQASKCS
jgi:hypothetical protein